MKSPRHHWSVFAFPLLLLAIAGCGGGGSTGAASPTALTPAAPGLPSTGASASAHVVISIPKPAASTGRKPAYVSPATQSISVAVDSGAPTVQNLAPSSPNCSSAGTAYPLNCTVPVTASAGMHSLTFITYDQPNAAGNQLSANSISVTFVAGQNPAIPVVLAGVPASFQVAPLTASTTFAGSVTKGFSLLGGTSQTLLIVALDADGNFIVGPGAPTLAASITAASAGSGFALSAASSSNPNEFTLNSTSTGTATLALAATPSSTLAGSALSASVPLTAAALVTTIVGKPGVSGVLDGTGTSGELRGPYGTTYDPTNNSLYIVDYQSCRIRQVVLGNGSANSGTLITIAGNTCGSGDTDGTGTAANFYYPGGIAYDSASGDLYVTDGNNDSIRQVTPGNGTANSGTVTTIAGSTTSGSADGTGASAQFSYPAGIAYDPDNNSLYVTDESNCEIRQVTVGNGSANSGSVTTIAGNTSCASSGTDGTGPSANFYYPSGIAYDTNNKMLYVTDSCGNAIRQVTPGNGTANSGTVTTIAGKYGSYGSTDGTGTNALFNYPNGIAYDAANGNLYVADSDNYTIRQVAPGTGSANTGVVTTIAGNVGLYGSVDGFGNLARFYYPYFPAYDSTNGDLYLTDYANYTIRQVQL